MARYKPYDVQQDKFIPVSFRDQILPGSFEYALSEIVDQHIDLALFAARYTNDETGRLAYDPAVLLKIVLYGYYKGIVSSRKLAEGCERHVVFMALSADTHPHFTTIADFISQMPQEVTSVFTDVLLCASELNLIGRDTFAIDGCKLPSIDNIKRFLKTAKPNLGPSGNERKSNITDPDSAKMSTNHGVIQGYNGIAVVDAQHQIVVTAQAHGEGQEAHLLAPMIESTRAQCQAAAMAEDVFDETKLTADASYSSQASVQYTQDHRIDAYIADRNHRSRDPAFADADRYKERSREEKRRRAGTNPNRFTAKDFDYDEANRTCRCPAGNALYRNGNHIGAQHREDCPLRGELAKESGRNHEYRPPLYIERPESANACRPGANRLGFGKGFFYRLVGHQRRLAVT